MGFDFIMAEIVIEPIQGVEFVSKNGRNVTLFMKGLRLVADYPSSSHNLDILNHRALSPCMYCFLGKGIIRNDEDMHIIPLSIPETLVMKEMRY